MPIDELLTSNDHKLLIKVCKTVYIAAEKSSELNFIFTMDLAINLFKGKGEDRIKKPSKLLLLTEIHRALFELSTFVPFSLLRSREKSGDGHPVLIIPGFMATDISTAPMRKFLTNLGYTAYGWGEGRNYANEQYLEELCEKLEDIFLTHRTRVSLIGWSLGGVFAREMGKTRPNLVRQIITLGSPFAGLTKPNNAMWIYEWLTDGRGTDDVDPELLAQLPTPAPVPTTAIYSKEDGVVPWQACMEEVEDDWHDNIQVNGSHLGLGVNPLVLDIIKDRLKYDRHNFHQRDIDKS